jgi:hypothetical protein
MPEISRFIHVNDVRYEGGHRLRLAFDDGAVKIVDLEQELDGPVFEPLRDIEFFRRVRVNLDTGTIEWPNGADFAPEFLYEIGRPAEETAARKVAEERGAYGEENSAGGPAAAG